MKPEQLQALAAAWAAAPGRVWLPGMSVCDRAGQRLGVVVAVMQHLDILWLDRGDDVLACDAVPDLDPATVNLMLGEDGEVSHVGQGHWHACIAGHERGGLGRTEAIMRAAILAAGGRVP